MGYLSQNGFSNSSINHHLASIHLFYDYLGKTLNIENQASRVMCRKIEEKRELLSLDEYKQIIDFLKTTSELALRDRVILLFMIYFGLNGQDICNLMVRNVKKIGDSYDINSNKHKFLITSENGRLFDLFDKFWLLQKPSQDKNNYLFLTNSGKPLTRPHIVFILKRLATILNLSTSSLAILSRAREILDESLIDTRYRIVSTLKTEQNCRVYLVFDTLDNNTKKVIKLIKSGENSGHEQLDELKKEFSFLSNFTHKNILKVYDIGHLRTSGEFFITTEYEEGKQAGEYIGKLNVREALAITMDLLSGLDYIHERNVLHYDIKPENIIIIRREKILTAKYVDLGLSDHIFRKFDGARGTIPFIAPELLTSNYSDARSDIFSLGVTLYYLLSAKLPFQKKDLGYLSEKPV